ncbi:hypothetical protein B9Y74_05545 [Stenotrophomonas maltophilia]|uniref:Lar family restriction alleviation protein n=1 Tax=Stenotrophomonas maltophilia TaxID=40324 RepID=UPI000C262EE4|nr:DUF551 domain-containing protein [Stenotrophomonas maltophilia]PJL51460.1 hypothetical protein B9Y74_05545 [Stenotrophomonas maltophilia]
MSEIELKTCPFCGAKPETGPWQKHGLTVQCSSSLTDCPIGPAYSHYEPVGAAAAWNTRAPQWQPIESAPKTTRSILVWCPERQNQYMVYWDRLGAGEWRNFGGCTVLTEVPTHWQPLPAAPEAV